MNPVIVPPPLRSLRLPAAVITPPGVLLNQLNLEYLNGQLAAATAYLGNVYANPHEDTDLKSAFMYLNQIEAALVVCNIPGLGSEAGLAGIAASITALTLTGFVRENATRQSYNSSAHDSDHVVKPLVFIPAAAAPPFVFAPPPAACPTTVQEFAVLTGAQLTEIEKYYGWDHVGTLQARRGRLKTHYGVRF